MARTYGQYCGVGAALEVVGERWALLIIRDLLVGPRRYTDLKQGLPKIPTNILSARLRELQDSGVVQRAHVAHCGLVYQLTPAGRGLEPIVLALSRWGLGVLDEPAPADAVTPDALTIAFRSAFRPGPAADLPPTAYRIRVGQVELLLGVSPDGLDVRPVGSLRPVDLRTGPTDPAPDLTIEANPGVVRLLAGTVGLEEAVADRTVVVAAGDPALLERFVATFTAGPNLLPTHA